MTVEKNLNGALISYYHRSSWQVTMDCDEIINNHTRGGNSWMIDPAHNKSRTLQGYTGHPYPFGVDPVGNHY